MECLATMISGGFVFYGGLIGAVIAVYIYSRQFKVAFKELLLTMIPVIPLIHTFGRIGCLGAGCCYGMEYHGFGNIVFHNSMFAPNGVELFPMQIVESICNLIIFAIILITYTKHVGTYKTVGLYLILYSVTRFVLEFFRGYLIRGHLFSISTSQWISIILFVIAIAIFVLEWKKKKNVEQKS